MTLRLTALALLLFAGAAHCADLGRLFFTPTQRATLDNARKQNIRAEISNDNAQSAAPVPQNISVNGVVRRSDGKSTIWINNRPVTGTQASGINVTTNKNDSRVKLSVPDSGRSVDLKVGQSVEIVSGTIAESYSRPVSKPEVKGPADAENTAASGDKAAIAPKSGDIAQKPSTGNKGLDTLKALERNSGTELK